MKRIGVLLMIGLLFNCCDDGDLVFRDISFSDDAILKRCSETSDIIYKIDTDQALVLEVPNLSVYLPTQPTDPDTPVILPINTTNRVVYRLYNGDPTSDNFCLTLQPASPSLSKEYDATAGTIEISTVAITVANTTAGFEGGQKITNLQHSIVFRGVTFDTGETPFTKDPMPFGNYTQPFTGPSLVFDDDLQVCNSTLLYNSLGATALTLDIDPALLADDLSAPLTGLISATTNKLTYNVFPLGTDLGALASYCDLDSGILPIEQWVGDNGVDNADPALITGAVEVTVTETAGVFKHEIHLKNVTLRKGTNSFLIATDYLYGTLITN